jgi:hypothetical protein
MNKIIIFGFPHCGTTIIRSIIGHIKNVYEYIYETNSVTDEMLEKGDIVVIKDPFMRDYYFTDKYKDYIKIFIIRNPYYVFSSLNKRFHMDKLPKNHYFSEWERTVERWLEYKGEPNFYCIKYEDLFANDFLCMRIILDDIGLEYNNDIFNNMDKDNRHGNFQIRWIRGQPPNKNHNSYRAWQINQPFENMNIPNKIDLTDDQINIITESKMTQAIVYSLPT